jgi:hypothetical protein
MSELLATAVAAHPLPEFGDWWPIGATFVDFMANAISSRFQKLSRDGDLAKVEAYAQTYSQLVYQRPLQHGTIKRFANLEPAQSYYSGEFDSISYAFYRRAFENINTVHTELAPAERREFTRDVGRQFFDQLSTHLELELPDRLGGDSTFGQMKTALTKIGRFLLDQGYLRTHFKFHFDVNLPGQTPPISQDETGFRVAVQNGTMGYALYEMGHPIILPSAVYLYNTLGEAQHHSSRTIEELFLRMGYQARETDDFDPTGFPSDRVVELWTIRERD